MIKQVINGKYKYYLLIIGICLLISLMLGVSYAYYMHIDVQEGKNIVTGDCFRLTFSEGDAINLTNSYPLSEEEASNLTPYTFTVKNICNNSSDFDINIEVLNSSTLETSNIRYKLNDEQSKILGSQTLNETIILDNSKESRTIYTSFLLPNQEQSFNLNLWLDENANTSQSANKDFNSKVVIVSSLNKIPKYVVTFDPNGGVIDNPILKVPINTAIGLIPLATRESSVENNYVFDGWYSQRENGTKIDSSTLITSDQTIYAHWTTNPRDYTITVNNGSGSGTYNYGDSVVIEAIPPQSTTGTWTGSTSAGLGNVRNRVLTNYTFNKWDDDNTSQSRTVIVAEDKTYTALFNENETTESQRYLADTVTFSYTGGWGSTAGADNTFIVNVPRTASTVNYVYQNGVLVDSCTPSETIYCDRVQITFTDEKDNLEYKLRVNRELYCNTSFSNTWVYSAPGAGNITSPYSCTQGQVYTTLSGGTTHNNIGRECDTSYSCSWK